MRTDEQLISVADPPETSLNTTPIYSDPANGPVNEPGKLPDPASHFAASQPKPAAPALPDPAEHFAASAPQTETTTNHTTGSSGLDAAAQGRANARLDTAGEANRTALDAETEARHARADYEVRATEQALGDVAQKRREAAAEAALNERIGADVDKRMQAASDWQPDRKNMFGFGAGRGLAAAVAIIAGGWMQGRGQTSTNQFLPFVMKMIDEDVNDQVRTNSANIQFLREQKGDIKAAAAELKKRQLMLVDSELQAKAAAAAAKDPSVQTAIEAYKSTSAAKQAEWDAQQRTALERTVTEQTSHVTTPVHAAAGPRFPSRLAARHATNNQFVREWRNIKAQLKSAEQAGDLNGYLGTVATHGVNWAQEHLNGLPPGQQKAAMLMARLEELNHLHTGSSMVGLSAEEKERFGKVGVPEKIRDVSNTYSYFDELARDKIEDNRAMAGMAGGTGEGDEQDIDEGDGGPEGTY